MWVTAGATAGIAKMLRITAHRLTSDRNVTAVAILSTLNKEPYLWLQSSRAKQRRSECAAGIVEAEPTDPELKSEQV